MLKKIEENIWKSFIRGYILNNPPWIQYWAMQDSSMIRIGHCVPWNVHLRCYSFDLANKGLEVQFCWSGTIYYSFEEKIKHQMITKTNERLKRPFLKNCFVINELSNTTRENSFSKKTFEHSRWKQLFRHSFFCPYKRFDFTQVLKFACYSNVLFTRTFF